MRKNTLHPQIKVLLDAIDLACDHRAWHGPNLRGSIRGVTSREAAWRPSSGRHNIWELVVHAAYWKYAARRRLRGDRRGAFPLPGSNWFARPAAADEKQWRADVALLEQEHRQLRVAVQSFSHSRLHQRPAPTSSSYLDLIVGIAFHDIYHAGQIQLLKRLYRARHG